MHGWRSGHFRIQSQTVISRQSLNPPLFSLTFLQDLHRFLCIPVFISIPSRLIALTAFTEKCSGCTDSAIRGALRTCRLLKKALAQTRSPSVLQALLSQLLKVLRFL
jgi:hypothetical protein